MNLHKITQNNKDPYHIEVYERSKVEYMLEFLINETNPRDVHLYW